MSASDGRDERGERQSAVDILSGLRDLARELEPLVAEAAGRLAPLLRAIKAASPLLQAVARGATELTKRWDRAEHLIAHGWIPHRTTPFELVSEHLDEDGLEATRRSLLAHYSDNWREVRVGIEAQLSTYRIDDEAKATLREALDGHEVAHYRSVCRLLFPEIERLFRTTLFDGRAGRASHGEFIRKLVGSDERIRDGGTDGLLLEDFVTGGIHEIAVFEYLTAGLRDHQKITDHPPSTADYIPGMFVQVGEGNIEAARLSPIPTRHAVVHGLVSYRTPQSSLNAIFIADYIFSVISQHNRKTRTSWQS